MFVGSGLLLIIVCFYEVVCFESSWLRSQIQPTFQNYFPLYHPTKGEVWPQPQLKDTTNAFFIIRPSAFQFKVTGQTCEILEKALQRYKQDLRSQDRLRRNIKSFYPNETRRSLIADENFGGYLEELEVYLRAPCEDLPHPDMDEQYELRIRTEDLPKGAILTSESIWGMLRGLETWSQLVYSSPDQKALLVNSTSILDFPRFSHRGLLLDTSRHFQPLRIIYMMLDAMAMTKMNVFHWHIVDDQSFPYQSEVFPDLSSKGAFAPTHVYTIGDVDSVIKYAAYRGIRVIPEFDTPGHMRSWGYGYPQILTQCYFNGKPNGELGPANPIKNETYDFTKKLFKEIKERFPDLYFHLGGDEVNFDCWEGNPEIQKFLKENNWNARQLEGYYVRKVLDIAVSLSRKPVVWQEVFDDGAVLPNETLIHIWKSPRKMELKEVTKKGYKVILSECWYLDHLSSGGDWAKFYGCDPHDFDGSQQQKKLVIGGEACMWGEFTDSNNVLQRVWPRACAAAEKLWSNRRNDYKVLARLDEHTCRMNRRKIPAQPPNGPGFCSGANFE